MIRYGIIGAGRMGNAHASQTKQIEGTAVTGVYDINPEAAQRMHADYGATIYQSAEEVANAPDVDCVIVTSPSISNTTFITSTEEAIFRYPHKIPVMIFV